MAMVKANGLVTLFGRALSEKWGYIYGAAGETWTQKKQDTTSDDMAIAYGQKWVGKRVADCSGLFSWAAGQLGGYLPHGSNSIMRKYTAKTWADMSEAKPGDAIFKVRPGTKYADGLDYYHIGLYIGDGRLIEAKGTAYGVVMSKVSDWISDAKRAPGHSVCFGRLKCVAYDDNAEEVTLVQGRAIVDVPNNGTVNVRANKSTTSAKLGTLREGEQCEILEDDGTWCRVLYKQGYIMSQYLREVGN